MQNIVRLGKSNFFFSILDKYYLVDTGYGIRNGFIPPYSGVRYHLKEYDDNPPQNEKELFNLRHSSLRTTIERGFGVLKKRFKVVDNDPFWDFKTQVDVILACCIIHNHIMGIAPNDMFMEEVIQEEQSETPNVLTEQASYTQPYQTQSERRAENREWARKRDAIAHAMYVDYMQRRQSR